MSGHPSRVPASRPRRPTFFGPGALDSLAGDSTDPAQRIEAAHLTANALISHARSGNDPELTARLVALADEHGLDEIAELWAARPSHTLPGALWRVYALRAGIRRDPGGVARAFDEGRRRAPVHEAVAGVADPPGPREVQDLADAVLAGAFTGDLAVALERAGAFCHVVATGWAVQADDVQADDVQVDDGRGYDSRAVDGPADRVRAAGVPTDRTLADRQLADRAPADRVMADRVQADEAGTGALTEAERLTRQASGLARTGTELEAAARRWRTGELS